MSDFFVYCRYHVMQAIVTFNHKGFVAFLKYWFFWWGSAVIGKITLTESLPTAVKTEELCLGKDGNSSKAKNEVNKKKRDLACYWMSNMYITEYFQHPACVGLVKPVVLLEMIQLLYLLPCCLYIIYESNKKIECIILNYFIKWNYMKK